MSRKHKEEAACPDCGAVRRVTVWDSINLSKNPKMKERVLSRSAFRYRCPACGRESLLDYGFLYHDPRARLMIYYVCSDEDEKEAHDIFAGESDLMVLKAELRRTYTCRIVRTQEDLIEKIRLFDAGRDDRVIEVYKAFAMLEILEGEPASTADHLTYLCDDEGREAFAITGGGRHLGNAAFQAGFYDQLAAALRDRLPRGEYLIDNAWALRMMKQLS